MIVDAIVGPSFTLVANEIIDEAFDLCGVGSEGEPISADQYARALRSLNLMIKAWGGEEHLWLRTERDLTLVAAQSAYTLEPKPQRVIEARRHNIASGIDTPLTEWSREEYYAMTNKGTQSTPTAFYYDPQRDGGTLYLWPTATTQVASQFIVQLTYLRSMDDVTTTISPADVPREWLLALTYGLAENLALKYGISARLMAKIEQGAAKYKALIESWDTEPASMFLQPRTQ